MAKKNSKKSGGSPTDKKKSAQTAPVAQPVPETTVWRKVRENAEAVIIAIILALIIRHYSLEAFEIPTGSMAPGLHGVHVDAQCPNCETVDAVGLQTDQMTNKLRLSLSSGYVYDGPCPDCGTAMHEGVGRPDADISCPKCENKRRGDPERYRRAKKGYHRQPVRCSMCTYDYFYFFEPKDTLNGHKILVNKFSYEAGDPERWQVIVFKFNRQRNYIKRLVGLPGEKIQVVDGDIRIDHEIERKPLDVQNDLWTPVHDTDVQEIGLEPVSAWASTGTFDRDPENERILFNALDGLASLRYLRPVRNHYSYNGGRQHGDLLVRDLRALVDVKVNGVDAAGSPRVFIDIRNDDIAYRLALPIGGGTAEVLRVPIEFAEDLRLSEDAQDTTGTTRGWSVFASLPEGTALDKGRSHEVDFSLVDRQIRVLLDGELLLELPCDSRDINRAANSEGRRSTDVGLSPTGNDVTIRARHAGGEVERSQLFRDIHYTTRGENFDHAVNGPYQIPDDGFFAMGDNSPSSLDSRAWGALSRQNLLGRGFAIFWPALPWRFEVEFIR